MRTTAGIHHITAIAADPQRNLDFYAGTLGLRLVKKTVNFDDPGTYHFYYGDRTGRPGTLLTFFPWPQAFAGRTGTGEAVLTAFAIPVSALNYWEDRLGHAGVRGVTRLERFGAPVLRFADPDGMGLELVGSPADGDPAPGPVPEAAAIRRFHGTTVRLRQRDATIAVATEVLGLKAAGEDAGILRLAPADPTAGVLDIIQDPAGSRGSLGAGSVHHIAWRASNAEEQLDLRAALVDRDLGVTPVVDRQYFQSIYFREPGGVLFEVATDGPGFLVDEPEATLGTALRLPPQYEPHRAAIEAALPALNHPAGAPSGVEG